LAAIWVHLLGEGSGQEGDTSSLALSSSMR
jgi:hypothetical protein